MINYDIYGPMLVVAFVVVALSAVLCNRRNVVHYITDKSPRSRALCASGHSVGNYGVQPTPKAMPKAMRGRSKEAVKRRAEKRLRWTETAQHLRDDIAAEGTPSSRDSVDE